jgi:hypothetical protein
MNIEKEIEKKLSLIVDRYLNLNISFNDLKKYLTGKNIQIVINELLYLETIYLKQNKDKNSKFYKNLIKDKIIKILKDREFEYKDKNESMKYIKLYENYLNTFKN